MIYDRDRKRAARAAWRSNRGGDSTTTDDPNVCPRTVRGQSAAPGADCPPHLTDGRTDGQTDIPPKPPQGGAVGSSPERPTKTRRGRPDPDAIMAEAKARVAAEQAAAGDGAAA